MIAAPIQTRVGCPGCGSQITAELADAIDAARRPDLRDQLLARWFHRWSCPGCATATEIEHAIVYTDLPRRQWLYAGVERDRAHWRGWEARLASDVARALSLHSPLLHATADGLRSRVVFGYEELREKLVIWEAGADDGLIECLKVRAIAADPTLALPGSRLVVDQIGRDDAVDLWWFAPGDAAPSRKLTAAPSWLADTDRDRGSLQLRFPELFHGGYVNLHRLAAG